MTAAARARVRVRAVRLRARAAATLALASAVGVAGFTWPLFVGRRSGLGHTADAPWLFVGLLGLVVAVVLAEIADGGMDAKAVALLGVLSAAGAALRPLGAGTAGVETVWFLMVLAGRALGAGFGFVLGALTLFTSALLTAGVGPWLPYQMLGAAWVGFGAGLLPRRVRGWPEVAMVAGYAAFAGLLYGLIIDMAFWPYLTTGQLRASLAFVPGDPVWDNLRRYLAYHLTTSLGWDVPRATVNFALTALAARPVLGALRRAARRAAFDAPVTFTEP
ncbi:MAG: ECF transporter S component [Mycobacteriales bacterium]